MAMSAATTPLMSRGSPILSRLKHLDSMMAYLEEAKGKGGPVAGTKSWISGGSASATTWSGFTSDSGMDSATSSSSDDESSATSAMRPRQSWVSPRLVVSADEAAVQVRAKGSLLARIGRLEDHVVKLKAEMKARELESDEPNTAAFGDEYKGATKVEKRRVKDQNQKHPLRAGRRRVAPVSTGPRPQAEGKSSGDGKSHGLLFKLLHPGSLFSPAKGCFIPGASSVKTLEKGEQNRKDARKEEPRRVKAGLEVGTRKSRQDEPAASHKPGKQKGLREVEVQRLLSLQGIQSFSTPYTPPPL